MNELIIGTLFISMLAKTISTTTISKNLNLFFVEKLLLKKRNTKTIAIVMIPSDDDDNTIKLANKTAFNQSFFRK